MSRAKVARRIATTAAVGSGGLGLMGGLAVGVLVTEVKIARRTVGSSEDVPPLADGRYGTAFADPLNPPLVLAFLGDSTAAGQGVQEPRQTPGALLASGLAAVAERPVDLVNVAMSGARSDDLARQVSLLEERGVTPDVAMVIIGANDVTSRVSPTTSVRHLVEAVRRLRGHGMEVVVGTCPDLGSVKPVYQPLRWVARRLSRQLAAAQTIAVVEEGGRTVSLGTLLGPEFEADPTTMFGPDHYHPSAEGYATAAMALLPSLCAALGVWPEERLETGRGEEVLPVARAAVAAVDQGGTEVAAADVDTEDGPTGRWALLRLRRRRRLPADEPVPSEAVGPGV